MKLYLALISYSFTYRELFLELPSTRCDVITLLLELGFVTLPVVAMQSNPTKA